MQIGLLWFDNDPQRGLETKIVEAANRYSEKFGRLPDTCYVNQAELNSQSRVVALASTSIASLRVMPSHNILPHHFWVGIESG